MLTYHYAAWKIERQLSAVFNKAFIATQYIKGNSYNFTYILFLNNYASQKKKKKVKVMNNNAYTLAINLPVSSKVLGV